MITNYGKDALPEAKRRSQTLRNAGCETTAATWKGICKIIRARLSVSTLIGDAVDPGLPEPKIVQNGTAKFSFFDM